MAEHWMEQVVREAQERGDFDRLTGRGRPLKLAEYDPYAGADAVGYGILKQAGCEINWLRANGRDPERPSRIVAVNILIAKHNRQVPNPSLQLPKLPSDFGR